MLSRHFSFFFVLFLTRFPFHSLAILSQSGYFFEALRKTRRRRRIRVIARIRRRGRGAPLLSWLSTPPPLSPARCQLPSCRCVPVHDGYAPSLQRARRQRHSCLLFRPSHSSRWICNQRALSWERAPRAR